MKPSRLKSSTVPGVSSRNSLYSAADAAGTWANSRSALNCATVAWRAGLRLSIRYWPCVQARKNVSSRFTNSAPVAFHIAPEVRNV